MKELLVSVIIPVYNVASYIGNCIDSVCNQTFKGFEVVLVDDGSMDESISIAESILKKNMMNYRIVRQENKGLAAARNAGIRQAVGVFVVCVDSDDVICKDFIKTVVGVNDPILALNFKRVKKESLFDEPLVHYENEVISRDEILLGFLKREYQIVCPAMFIRRDFLIKNGFWYDESVRFSEDQLYIWNVLFTAESVVYNRTALYNYYIRSNSIMTSSSSDNILTGYSAIKRFCESKTIKDDFPEIVTMILPRWILGALRTSTKLMSNKDFKLLAKQMESKKNMHSLLKFPESRARKMARLFIFSPEVFYFVARRV